MSCPCGIPRPRLITGIPRRFVHGDLGRTEPSLASLVGCESDILQLDVLEVHDDVAAAPVVSSS